MIKNTITFSRHNLELLKEKLDKANKNNHVSFVWKNSLMSVRRAQSMIEAFKQSDNGVSEHLTIEYTFD